MFKLILPRDSRFVPAVRLIAERAAQCAGYTAADAARIASSVGRAFEMVLARPVSGASAPGASDSVDIRLEREGGYLDVWLRYVPGNNGSPTVDASSDGALRAGMDSAEFGREGEVEYCRLRRRLPREKVDHQCELPPDAR